MSNEQPSSTGCLILCGVILVSIGLAMAFGWYWAPIIVGAWLMFVGVVEGLANIKRKTPEPDTELAAERIGEQ